MTKMVICSSLILLMLLLPSISASQWIRTRLDSVAVYAITVDAGGLYKLFGAQLAKISH